MISLVKGIPPNTDLSASSSKDLPSDSDSESDDSEDDSAVKISRSYKRPCIQWDHVVYFVKADEATMDEDEIKSQVQAVANKIMEDSRRIRPPGHITRPGESGLWKEICSWKIDGGKTSVKWCRCPMSYQFRCKIQVKFYNGWYCMALDVCWQHNADSHSAEKDTSMHVEVKQILALHKGVCSAPSQSARALLRNLVNFSPDKRINPIKIRVVRSTVAKFRADLSRLTTRKSMILAGLWCDTPIPSSS
jgi:hypothetical protein